MWSFLSLRQGCCTPEYSHACVSEKIVSTTISGFIGSFLMVVSSIIKLKITQDSKTAVLCLILPDVYKKAQSLGIVSY